MMWRLGPNAFVSSTWVEPLTSAVDSVFSTFRVSVDDLSSSARPLELDARVDDSGGWRLYAQGAPIARASKTDALAPLLEGSLVGYAVRNRRDSAAFHAAAVIIGGKGVLLLGPKGSGKSTLSLWLTKEGATYLGDEVTFVRFQDARIAAFTKAITLKRGSFHLFPELEEAPTHEDPIRGPIRYAQPPFSEHLSDHPVDLIVLPRFRPEIEAAQVTALESRETALCLVQQCFGGLERGAPRTLDLIARLAMVPAIAVDLPSCESGSHAIREAVEGLK
jgi:hypothetical protein